METIHTKNFRVQVWFNCTPDKILLGTVSVCADGEEGALLLTRAHMSYYLVGSDNLNWQVKEPAAVYTFN